MGMTTKTTYKVGPKGQVVLPKALREELGIEPGDEVDVRVEHGDIYIRKVQTSPDPLGILRDPNDPLPLTRALELERQRERAREEQKAADRDAS
jgi:AbrB family looped-hinge helix DNA binding protein